MKPNLPLKFHGGKVYIASKIVELMPPHLHYVEPYAGGLSVLLTKNPEGVSEVANDINRNLTNFWETLRDPDRFEQFRRLVEATPFSELEWCQSRDWLLSYGDAEGVQIPRAVNFFILCRQSLAGRMRSFTGVTKTRTRRGMNNEVSAWLTAIEGLPAVHERLKRVLILNRPAIDVIHWQDAQTTLFYLDPPYVHETRATTGEYAHEMTEDQHAELLATLATIKGKFLLSGYRCPLYDAAATRWRWTRHDFELPNNAAGGKEKRRMVESLWCNFSSPNVTA
jgi:DNA adenine methylase